MIEEEVSSIQSNSIRYILLFISAFLCFVFSFLFANIFIYSFLSIAVSSPYQQNFCWETFSWKNCMLSFYDFLLKASMARV